MNHEELSDFEINKRVASFRHSPSEMLESGGSSVCMRFDGIESCNRDFNPCNDPADAWPIIVENKISLQANTYDGYWCATNGEFYSLGECIQIDGVGGIYELYSKNPLRAAMIVYLMMQEAES